MTTFQWGNPVNGVTTTVLNAAITADNVVDAATYAALSGATFTGPVAIDAPATAGWNAAGGDLFVEGNISAGLLAVNIPAGFAKTRGLNIQNGVAVLAGDVEDAHGALILGSIDSIGGGATTKQVFGAEIQAQTLPIAGITPDSMTGVNGIACYQSDGTMGAGVRMVGVAGVVQIGFAGLASTVANAYALYASPIESYNGGNVITNAIGVYSPVQTVGTNKWSGFFGGNVGIAAGGKFSVGGAGLTTPPQSALSLTMNTASAGITNLAASGISSMQLGASTEQYLAWFNASGFLIGGYGITDIHGTANGDHTFITRGYGFGNHAFKVNDLGSVIVGNAGALATTATDGFLYLNSVAGTPTGVPTAQTGTIPVQIDTAGSKLWAYIGGAWKGILLV